MIFSDGVCKRTPQFRGAVLGTWLRSCALDWLVEVVVEGTSSRTVYSGSLCSSDFGGHPC